MQMKDKIAVACWLRTGASLDDVMKAEAVGIIGNQRFTEDARKVYYKLWLWSAFRFYGKAGEAQERYVELRGVDALKDRFERVNAWIKKNS